jgi:hypothetical protein
LIILGNNNIKIPKTKADKGFKEVKDIFIVKTPVFHQRKCVIS